VDHETALEAANQALSGAGWRSPSRIASVELRGVDEARRTGRAALNIDDTSRLPSGAWELCAMLSVGLVTVLFVVALWFI
jgi:hypothetical protein